ncbi:MAG: DoxX family protein, partial [Muribaculaceae bacterium]|nr:DoxX family protein [Muribaculaceae bacterium]
MENKPVEQSPIAEKHTSPWLKFVVALLRVAVGGVFIFSGFLKAIDPWGTVYKFNEYLIVFGMSDYLDLSSFLASIVAITEFVLGIMTFTGIYRRLAPWGIFLMMLVMLPLTLYLAVTDAVPDCGCFGDFIKLSNISTFVKNIFITAGAVLLLIYNRRLVNYFGVAVQWLIVVASTIYVGLIAFIGFYYQPMIDFRDFKVGTPIVASSDNAADDMQFIYSNGSEERVFTIDNLPADDSGW